MLRKIHPYLQKELLQILYNTRAVSIWNHKTDRVFWYASNTPGPFYINTEKLIGAHLADTLLNQMDSILQTNISPEKKAYHIDRIVMDAYQENVIFQRIVSSLCDIWEKKIYPKHNICCSGGERRDWLFSIPFAHEIGVKHMFLFKNHESYCSQITQSSLKQAIHISDLIHQASSYCNLWIPILDNKEITMTSSYTVLCRGTEGLRKLENMHIPIYALAIIDINFFQQLKTNNLIHQKEYDELSIYFENKAKWAHMYLIPNINNAVLSLDKKSNTRFKSFIQKDPWNLGVHIK